MCIFCSSNENIDISDKEIFHAETYCGFLGNIHSVLLINRDEKHVELAIYRDDGDLDTLFSKTITFCPFCGEKF